MRNSAHIWLFIIRILIGIILIVAGVFKLLDIAAFLGALGRLHGIPGALAPTIAAALPVTEIALGISIMLGNRISYRAGLLLNGAFLLVLSYNVFSGNTGIDCGCFGKFIPSRTDFFAIGRQTVLTALSLILVIRRPRRPETMQPLQAGNSAVRYAHMVVWAGALIAALWVYFIQIVPMQSAEIPPSVAAIDGSSVNVSAGAVLVIFFDPECEECGAEATSWEVLHRGFKGTLFVVGVSRRNAGEIKAFVAEHRLSFPVVEDGSGHLAAVLNSSRTPDFVLLSNGSVVYRRSPDESLEESFQKITSTLAARGAGPKENTPAAPPRH